MSHYFHVDSDQFDTQVSEIGIMFASPTFSKDFPDMPFKRTKIMATLGPASCSEETIRQLIAAGANAFRLNFSHGSHEAHRQTAEIVRQVAEGMNEYVALMGDLQGPKIRVGKFANGSEPDLVEGECFLIDCSKRDDGDSVSVGVTYSQLAEDCEPGQVLLLDDGRIELEIVEKEGARLTTKVLVGGKLTSNKGINLRDGGLSAPALTEKDFADIKLAAALKLDYLAVSFPRNVDDIESARTAMENAGCAAKLVSKIERAEAVAEPEVLDDMIRASDAVMVARGDLGVEIGDSELIGVQKKLIQRCRELNRVVITATQMMESMIENSLPTRAEVFDVANAVLDGTDVVMLSAETATGRYPVKVVEAMTRIIRGAEKHSVSKPISTHREKAFSRTDEAIAVSAMFAANHFADIKGIICLTESGSTPLLMSRIRSGMPIYAFSHSAEALRRVAFYRGVTAFHISYDKDYDHLNYMLECLARLKNEGILKSQDQVIATVGEYLGKKGGTNTLKILPVP